jgi:hypothetical protein
MGKDKDEGENLGARVVEGTPLTHLLHFSSILTHSPQNAFA